MSGIDGIIFDLDGVLYEPTCTGLDVPALWDWSKKRFSKFKVFTNDVTFPKEERCADALLFGAEFTPNDLITPIDVFFDYMAPCYGLSCPYFWGDDGQLKLAGRSAAKEIAEADCFLIGDLSKIGDAPPEEMLKRLREQTPVFVLNTNRSNHPSGRPDIGSLALRFCYDADVQFHTVGKPAWTGFQHVLNSMQLPARKVVFLTDHAVNDASGSVIGGLPTVLIEAESYWSNVPACIDAEIRSFIRSPHRRKRTIWA